MFQIKISSLKKSKLVVDFAYSKKAEDAIILNIGKVANICDYFVICSAESDRKVKTIATAIEDGLEKEGIKIIHSEGYDESVWILIDTGDVVIHVFRTDMREFYSLERLWAHAPKVAV